MAVPFIDLKRLTSRVRNDVLDAWTACLDNTEFVGGPRVTAVEKELERVLGAPKVVSCANGTDALIVALQASGIRNGMKVALPNLTFWATFEAIVQLGATPVLVDISIDDLQIDCDQLKLAHEAHRFDAVLMPHLYGWCSARLREIRAFCKERAVTLIEDGAQCFGVDVGGMPILAEAAWSTMSFYPAKVVGGAMDGGAIAMQTEEQALLVRSLCNHGRSAHYSYAHAGWNSRMGGLQGAFLLRVLQEVPAILESRRGAAAYYRKRLAGEKGIRVWAPPAGVTENGYLNVLTVEGRGGQEIVDALKKVGVGAARTYPETIDSQEPTKKSGAIVFGDLRHSRSFCEKVVNLPLFFGIREDECEESVRALLGAR